MPHTRGSPAPAALGRRLRRTRSLEPCHDTGEVQFSSSNAPDGLLGTGRDRVLALVGGDGYRSVHPPRRFGGWVQAPVPAGALRFLPVARLVDRAVAVGDHRRHLGPSEGARQRRVRRRVLGTRTMRATLVQDPRIPCAWPLSLFCLMNDL